MSLDIHNLKNNDFLFSLEKIHFLEEIFREFYYRTGILIDEYSDTIINITHQKILVKIIEDFILSEKINNKEKIMYILELSGILKFFIKQEIDIIFLGD